MIAPQANPIAPVRLALDQRFDHAAAIGATINVVAQKNNARLAPAVGFDQGEGMVKQGLLAVDVANGVNWVRHD